MLEHNIYTEITLASTFRRAPRLHTKPPSVVGSKIGTSLLNAWIETYNNNILLYEIEVLHYD